MDDRESHPPLQNRSAGLLKADRLPTTDAERLEHRRRRPRELGPGVHENVAQQSAVALAQRRLDFHIRAQQAHIVGHGTSRCLDHYYPNVAYRVKRAHGGLTRDEIDERVAMPAVGEPEPVDYGVAEFRKKTHEETLRADAGYEPELSS